jgi:hypothetical protein
MVLTLPFGCAKPRKAAGGLTAVAGPPEFGPVVVRASLTLENGSEELLHVATQAHPEQVVRKLREADRLLSEGMELPEVFKHLEVAEATYHVGGTSTAG